LYNNNTCFILKLHVKLFPSTELKWLFAGAEYDDKNL
jgi:hypothetical protein